MPKESLTPADAPAKPAPETDGEPSLDQSRLLGLLGYNLRRAYVQILWLWTDRMAKLKLRPAEFSVLILISSNPEITQKKLARALAIEPPNMATMLDRLEGRGLLKREVNPDDKRSQFLALTPSGERLCTKAEKVANELELEASSSLTDDDRAELTRLLQKTFLK